MENTVRRLILENILTTIEGIASILKVGLHEFDIRKIETYPAPCAFVYPDTGDAIELGSRFETWKLPVIVEVWGQGIEVEDIIGEVHVAMMQDKKRGGYAELTRRMPGTDIMMHTGDEDSYIGLAIKFEVTYKHILDDPFSQEED
jgi:hypothetical protein